MVPSYSVWSFWGKKERGIPPENYAGYLLQSCNHFTPKWEERQVKRRQLRRQRGIHRPGFHSGPHWNFGVPMTMVLCKVRTQCTCRSDGLWQMQHQAIAGTTKGADADIAEMLSVRVLSRDGEFFNHEKTLFKTKVWQSLTFESLS